MREIPFSNIQEISKNINNRKVVMFGSGNVADKTARLLTGYDVHAVADNAENLWGDTSLGNVQTVNPAFLKADNGSEFYVIICTTSFEEVSKQLVSYGLIPSKDFVVSPIMNDLRIISELESINKKLMFSSGAPSQDSPLYGGGIYEMTIKDGEWNHEKKIAGNCYGIIKYKGNYISVDTDLGIFEFDDNYKIIRQGKLPVGSRGHGVAYCEANHKFYVVASYLDAVLEIDADTLEVLDQINISNKKENTGDAEHHCNDCLVVGTSLYVSMFSYTGNWKRDIFDGVVLEIDLTTKGKVAPIIEGLYMPHNIAFLAGGIHVLDSLPGYLRKNNASIVGQFPAFTRGLDFDGAYYYIGQSRNRNFSKNVGVSNNISIDTGIVVFDDVTKVSRTFQLPSKLSEIHSIVAL
jgi:hypothetical protein